MNAQRCVLDLQGYGRIFRRHLLDLGLKKDVDPNGVMSASELDFAYNECTSQIISALGLDMARFFMELQSMPNLRLLAHIPQFNIDDVKFSADGDFHSKFSAYAMGLVEIISRTLTIQADVDYLLEALAEDYIIIMRIPKVNHHA
jgi:hypothetical protein